MVNGTKKQDRQGARTPAELERRYNFEERFDAAMGAAEEAGAAVKKLDDRMNQEELFNRLTNNGKAQGVFIGEDGQLYINASYLVTGVLSSRDGTTFYLDLDSGILKGQFTEFSISGKTVDTIAQEKADTAKLEANNYADRAVNEQTQTDIFNKLTNNGASAGVFIADGQLYVNASYLTAGVLMSADGETFYLDLENNIFKIMGKTPSWKDNEDGTFTLIGT